MAVVSRKSLVPVRIYPPPAAGLTRPVVEAKKKRAANITAPL